MKNVISDKFKIIEKPNNLNVNVRKSVYYDIIATLEVIDAEKCIQMAKDELGRNVQNFRTYLSTLVNTQNKSWRVASSYDEDKEVLYIWKRDKLKGGE